MDANFHHDNNTGCLTVTLPNDKEKKMKVNINEWNHVSITYTAKKNYTIDINNRFYKKRRRQIDKAINLLYRKN